MENRPRAALFEDDGILAGALQDVMTILGYEVVECAGSLPQALRAAAAGSFDLAVVDLRLRGQDAYPLLDLLNERGVPFVIATGSYITDLIAPYDQEVIVLKPYSIAALQDALALLSERASRPNAIRR